MGKNHEHARSYSTLVNSRAPQHAPGAATQFKTWSSINHELAPSLCIPPASKVLPSVARSALQEDRALIKWLSDAAFLVGLVLFICASAASIPLALFNDLLLSLRLTASPNAVCSI